MIYSNYCAPSMFSPTPYYGGGGGYGCSLYNSCCSYSGGFCPPARSYNPWGAAIGGARGFSVGSAIGGALGLGLGMLGGGFLGGAYGLTMGSMFGGSLGYLGGSMLGGYSSGFCW